MQCVGEHGQPAIQGLYNGRAAQLDRTPGALFGAGTDSTGTRVTATCVMIELTQLHPSD